MNITGFVLLTVVGIIAGRVPGIYLLCESGCCVLRLAHSRGDDKSAWNDRNRPWLPPLCDNPSRRAVLGLWLP